MTKHTKQAIIVSVVILLVLCLGIGIAIKNQEIKWWYWWWQFKSTKSDEEKLAIIEKYKKEKAVSFLLMIMKAEHPGTEHSMRQAASIALSEIGERSIKPLIDLLRSEDEDMDVRCEAEYALVLIGKKAVEPLIQALDDKDYDLRYHAMRALGDIKNREAVPALIKALRDKSVPQYAEGPNIRALAAIGLANMGDKLAIEPIRTAIKVEQYPDERKYMQEALEKLQSLPDTPPPGLRGRRP